MRYTITDFAGRSVLESDARPGPGSIIEVRVQLARGYHEIAFPSEGLQEESIGGFAHFLVVAVLGLDLDVLEVSGRSSCIRFAN